MFAQLRSAQDHAAGGLGIGLALAKGMVELHGGRIEAASGGTGRAAGSRCGCRTSWHGARQAADAGRRTNGHAASARRILLADDNRDAAESLAIILRLEGHEVELAHDGQAALRSFAERGPTSHCSTSACRRPTDYEVARQIRADARWRRGAC